MLFGGTNSLYRLSGSDISDFRSEKISGVGPLNSHSFGVLRNSLAFVGASGFYVTDGSSVENVSEPALDEYFANQLVQNGSVVYLDDNSMMFYISARDRGTLLVNDSLFVFNDKHWVRWNVRADQWAVTKFLDNRYLFTDGTGRLKEIDLEIERLDGEVDWLWESNPINGGDPTTRKRFRRIEILGQAAEDVTLTIWQDTNRSDLVSWEIDRNSWVHDQSTWSESAPKIKTVSLVDSFYATKVPVFCLSRRLRIMISGRGTCIIRSIKLVFD